METEIQIKIHIVYCRVVVAGSELDPDSAGSVDPDPDPGRQK
jgi:hypothetical protein